MANRVEALIKSRWYQFDLLPADVNEQCAGCGKFGEMCRGGITIGGYCCCVACSHHFGMVHRQSQEVAPPFDTPEAVAMMYDIIDLNEAGARRGIGTAIRRHFQHWQERNRGTE